MDAPTSVDKGACGLPPIWMTLRGGGGEDKNTTISPMYTQFSLETF